MGRVATGGPAALARTGGLDHRQAAAARLASRLPYSMAAVASEAALPLIITEMTLVRRPVPPSSTLPVAHGGSVSMDLTAEQQKALARLAEYPRREERLRQMWADGRRSRERHFSVGGGSAGSSRLRRAGASVMVSGSSLGHTSAATSAARRSRAASAGRLRGANSTIPAYSIGMGIGGGLADHDGGYFAGAFGGRLTMEQIEDLMTRDITPEDYDLLLCLDEGLNKARTLSTTAAAALPRPSNDSWIGADCRICLCSMEVGEDVRALPSCSHVYHAACAERWLATGKASCPICGAEVAEASVG